MKAIVFALCLLIPMSAWAQKEGSVDPQHLKMIKKGNQAESEGKGLASGIQKSQKVQQPVQPDEPAPPAGDAGGKAAGAAMQQAQ